MWAFKWLAVIISLTLGIHDLAFGADTWPTWSGAQPYVSKQVPQAALIARGEGTNSYYVLEADPATGALKVTGTITASNPSVGPTGSTVPTSATLVGGTSSGTLVAVKVASDGTVAVSGSATQTGGAYADSARKDYSAGSVTTGAWVQLIASTAAVINCITLFDSSGQTLELGIGAAASETRTLIIPPGGLNGCIPLHINASTRVSVRAVSGTASVGELDLTGIQ